MSYRHNHTATATTTHATRPAPAGQRSYIVSIDTGSFANVEIVVGDYHHRAGVWTSHSRADTVKVTNKSHVYAYGMLLADIPLSPPRRLTVLPHIHLTCQSTSDDNNN